MRRSSASVSRSQITAAGSTMESANQVLAAAVLMPVFRRPPHPPCRAKWSAPRTIGTPRTRWRRPNLRGRWSCPPPTATRGVGARGSVVPEHGPAVVEDFHRLFASSASGISMDIAPRTRRGPAGSGPRWPAARGWITATPGGPCQDARTTSPRQAVAGHHPDSCAAYLDRLRHRCASQVVMSR